VSRVAIVQLQTPKDARPSAPRNEAEFLHALRLRAADALERAYRFLEGQPDAWARDRARVLCGATPPSTLAERLRRHQRDDGSFPLGTLVAGGGLGFPSLDPERLGEDDRTLVGTLEALLVAADASLFHGAWLERAARALESRQASDGAYRVSPAALVVAPGGRDEAVAAADVFFTGMIAGLLGRTPLSRPDTLERAGAFLGTRFTPEAVEHDGYPALMAYSIFFTNVGHDRADEALQWCGRALEKGFRSRRLDAVATLRVLLASDAQAMPGATFDVVELLDRLLAEQAGDGGFAELSPGGPASRTTQTFDAMLALVRLCGLLPSGPSDPSGAPAARGARD